MILMQEIANFIRKVRLDFILSGQQVLEIADSFKESMVAGLGGRESCLKMLPSFLARPSGREEGIYLAVDFGGTNVRVLLVELEGRGKFRVLDRRLFQLRDSREGYDFTSPGATARELFGFIAGKIEELVLEGKEYPLGHTFSFPSRQLGVNRAVLLKWTKEIKTSGLEGEEVSEILLGCLERRKLQNVVPMAVINDTVGTLLASAYDDAGTVMGSICGTGHNTCYVEPRWPLTGKEMIVNMESGNFDRFPLTFYDRLLDSESGKIGEQLLEKAVSAHYIGDLAGLIIREAISEKLIFTGLDQKFFGRNFITARDISLLLADQSKELTLVAQWLGSKGIADSLLEERVALKTVASIIITRSAQLVAATYLGVLKHIDPQNERQCTIAVDGSLYELTPGYAGKLRLTLDNILKEKAGLAKIRPARDGSGVGAAIAAAIARLLPQNGPG